MKRKSKSILKSIMTVVLTVAMVLGAVPLPGGVLTVRAEGGTVAEIEIASWAALKGNSNAASVTTTDGVTTITLNSCIKLTASLKIASDDYAETPYVLDLNGYGIRYAGDADASVINPGLRCSSLTLKDSTPSRAIYYITLTDGRGTAVSDSAPSGTEGTDYLAVTGGYITGGMASNGGGVCCSSFTMEGGTIGYADQSGYSVDNTGHFYLKSGSSAQYYGNFVVEETFGNAAQTISTVTVGSLTNGQITVSDPAWTDNTIL